ncbi:MAG TPA: hypothetical protein PLJ65_12815, partial [Casimicrobium sp.]|nr:hypothetical protein [Casimicrobium sp.]
PMRSILWAEIAGLPLTAIFGFGYLFLSISGIGGSYAPADVRNVSVGSVMLLAGIACAAVVIGFWVWLAPSSKIKPATLTRQ